MRGLFFATLLIGVLSASISAAQSTVPVDAVIADCIKNGQSHQACACTVQKLRSEIGEQNYTDLLRVFARISELKALGRDEIVTAPNAGPSEYQFLLGQQSVMMAGRSIHDLANRASDDLCNAQTDPLE